MKWSALICKMGIYDKTTKLGITETLIEAQAGLPSSILGIPRSYDNVSCILSPNHTPLPLYCPIIDLRIPNPNRHNTKESTFHTHLFPRLAASSTGLGLKS